MNDLEMIQALRENPRRKATHNKGYSFVMFKENVLTWDSFTNNNPFRIVSNDSDCINKNWEIIEPERTLKQMSFAEACLELYQNVELTDGDIISVFSDKSLDRNLRRISLDEFKGLWTVEGIYED